MECRDVLFGAYEVSFFILHILLTVSNGGIVYRYVSAIHIPTFAPETLLSGGGDGTLKEWEWMTGKMKAEMDISASIHDFIKMKGGRKKWWEKATEQKENEEEAEVVEEEEEEAEAEAEDKMEDSKEKEKYPKPQETIQVLHKIDSFESGAKRWIVFSAIGYVFPSQSQHAVRNGLRMK